MPEFVSGNAVIGQSGGPTAVINQSLVGLVEGLQAGLATSGKVKRILGMRHGVRGLVAAIEERSNAEFREHLRRLESRYDDQAAPLAGTIGSRWPNSASRRSPG